MDTFSLDYDDSGNCIQVAYQSGNPSPTVHIRYNQHNSVDSIFTTDHFYHFRYNADQGIDRIYAGAYSVGILDTVIFNYDSTNLCTKIESKELNVSFAYDEKGRMTKTRFSNHLGATWTNSYSHFHTDSDSSLYGVSGTNGANYIFTYEDYTVEEEDDRTAISPHIPSLGFEVFPNPSKGEVNIVAPEGINQVIIRDVSGRIVAERRLEAPVTNWTIFLPHIANGVYFLQVSRHGISAHKTLLINK